MFLVLNTQLFYLIFTDSWKLIAADKFFWTKREISQNIFFCDDYL